MEESISFCVTPNQTKAPTALRQFVLGQSRPKFVTYEMKSNVPHLSGQDRTVLLSPEQLWIATKSVGQDCPSPGVISFVIIAKYNHLPH